MLKFRFITKTFHSEVRKKAVLNFLDLLLSNYTAVLFETESFPWSNRNRKLPVSPRRLKINGGCRRGKKSMKFTRLISSTRRIWTKNNSEFVTKTFPVRISSRLICSAMDQDNSTASANGVVEKTASQLKKEAQRQAKMEKFAKKKEKEAALMENQNQVILRGFQFKGVF